METKIKKGSSLFIALTLAFFSAIGLANAKESDLQEAANIVKILTQKGKFKEIKVINEVLGLEAQIFLDKKSPTSTGFPLMITKLENNDTIASGKIAIDLNWITKDNKIDVLKEILNKLKELGITASIREEDDVIIITITKFNENKSDVKAK